MAPLAVHIKHAGKVYDVQLDPDQPPVVFKEAIFHVTSVPVDRMKVLTKTGVLKDDTPWKKVAPKAGQTFTVIGAAGELPKAPEKPIIFLEDMDDKELAEALAKPVGLINLGNTCYMNATIQAMRAIPELQAALNASVPTTPLPKALRDLYANMSKTTEGVTPVPFLQILRQVVPQFGETTPRGFAQQDAEECWVQLTNSLKEIPAAGAESGEGAPAKKFVEQYMMGEMRREYRCDEAPEEATTTSVEKMLKVECNITISTNYMHTGITDALNQKVEKNSPSLGRQAIYTQTSRMTRLPTYLTVHMVRFVWRRDINKKAKILRKVKFPQEFDALGVVTDELKEKLTPVSRRLMIIEKERAERRKVRKRTKVIATGSSSKENDVEMVDATAPAASASVAVATTSATTPDTEAAETAKGKEKEIADGELEDESVYRERELQELEALVSPELKNDVGCSLSGLYDLVAIVTHKGAAADSGHYIGFVKKSVFHTASDADGDDDWYKFDDDKVSIFPKEKINTLDGGGEDSAAYVLLYKSKSLA